MKQFTKNGILYFIGNACILLSVCGFIYIFYPIVQMYLFPPSVKNISDNKKDTFSILIPKIHAYSPIIENVDPWNEKEYMEALKKGVAHAKNSFFPGESGTIFLFAHSSGPPWEITRYNTIFLRLGELKNEDEIDIKYKNKVFRFFVVDKKEVWPDEIQYLENVKNNQLVIQTCTPIGTSLKRLLIFAKQKDS